MKHSIEEINRDFQGRNLTEQYFWVISKIIATEAAKKVYGKVMMDHSTFRLVAELERAMFRVADGSDD